VAKVKSNILLDGVSGKEGESLVFRQVRGVTIVAKAPDVSRRTVSPAAKKHLNKFQRAKDYARQQMRDPKVKAAYHVAIGDYMNSPKMELIDVSSYHGRMSDIIRVLTTDDFQVTRVHGVFSRKTNPII